MTLSNHDYTSVKDAHTLWVVAIETWLQHRPCDEGLHTHTHTHTHTYTRLVWVRLLALLVNLGGDGGHPNPKWE